GANLKKAREFKGWTQEKAASIVGVSRPAFGAYEEGRAFPGVDTFIRLAEIFHVKDLVGFVRNEKFDPRCQAQRTEIPAEMSNLVDNYRAADIREKLAVNILLGLVDLAG